MLKDPEKVGACGDASPDTKDGSPTFRRGGRCSNHGGENGL